MTAGRARGSGWNRDRRVGSGKLIGRFVGTDEIVARIRQELKQPILPVRRLTDMTAAEIREIERSVGRRVRREDR